MGYLVVIRLFCFYKRREKMGIPEIFFRYFMFNAFFIGENNFWLFMRNHEC